MCICRLSRGRCFSQTLAHNTRRRSQAHCPPTGGQISTAQTCGKAQRTRNSQLVRVFRAFAHNPATPTSTAASVAVTVPVTRVCCVVRFILHTRVDPLFITAVFRARIFFFQGAQQWRIQPTSTFQSSSGTWFCSRGSKRFLYAHLHGARTCSNQNFHVRLSESGHGIIAGCWPSRSEFTTARHACKQKHKHGGLQCKHLSI